MHTSTKERFQLNCIRLKHYSKVNFAGMGIEGRSPFKYPCDGKRREQFQCNEAFPVISKSFPELESFMLQQCCNINECNGKLLNYC